MVSVGGVPTEMVSVSVQTASSSSFTSNWILCVVLDKELVEKVTCPVESMSPGPRSPSWSLRHMISSSVKSISESVAFPIKLMFSPDMKVSPSDGDVMPQLGCV